MPILPPHHQLTHKDWFPITQMSNGGFRLAQMHVPPPKLEELTWIIYTNNHFPDQAWLEEVILISIINIGLDIPSPHMYGKLLSTHHHVYIHDITK
ncbi:hypothetical protein TNCT_245111 [Trichonephila clavata]|uniref:Uncharacterized protein n=1 Tax=Trichonephila clavata TaxID=2740835 RepID=A0A8X6J761_TRICU|nr:hypothetical protein TNCT_245111 [Trichonephila clavata]